jgi:hypothetical protein
MEIRGMSPETGKEYLANAQKVDRNFIKFLTDFEMSQKGVKRLIDNLDISADEKVLLFSFSEATIRVGEYVVKIGRKIIDVVCKICKEYPSTSFGVILGLIAGFLLSSIPVIGVVLGPIFAPIAVLLGLLGGLIEDLKDKALIRRIKEAQASFSPLGTD